MKPCDALIARKRSAHQSAGAYNPRRGWPNKPRWSSDGKTLYFLSKKSAGRFNVWAVRMDPGPAGEPFQLTHFDGPGVPIDPDVSNQVQATLIKAAIAVHGRQP